MNYQIVDAHHPVIKMTDNFNTNSEQDELSGDDYYDEYFGDDDVADPDFIPPTKIRKKS